MKKPKERYRIVIETKKKFISDSLIEELVKNEFIFEDGEPQGDSKIRSIWHFEGPSKKEELLKAIISKHNYQVIV